MEDAPWPRSTPTPVHTNGRRAPDRRSRARPSGPEIQRFGALRSLPIGLPETARSSSCRLLNEILADSMVLYAPLQEAPLARRRADLLPAPPALRQARRGAARDRRPPRRARPEPGRDRRRRPASRRRADDHPAAARRRRGGRASMIDRTLQAHETVIEKVRAAINATEKTEDWGIERPADGRRPAPPRAAGLVPRRARRGRAARRPGAGPVLERSGRTRSEQPDPEARAGRGPAARPATRARLGRPMAGSSMVVRGAPATRTLCGTDRPCQPR